MDGLSHPKILLKLMRGTPVLGNLYWRTCSWVRGTIPNAYTKGNGVILNFPAAWGFFVGDPKLSSKLWLSFVIGKLLEKRGITALCTDLLMVQNMFHAVLPLLSKTVFLWAVSMSQNDYVRFFRITVRATICICLIIFLKSMSFDILIWYWLFWYVQILKAGISFGKQMIKHIEVHNDQHTYHHICMEYTSRIIYRYYKHICMEYTSRIILDITNISVWNIHL